MERIKCRVEVKEICKKMKLISFCQKMAEVCERAQDMLMVTKVNNLASLRSNLEKYNYNFQTFAQLSKLPNKYKKGLTQIITKNQPEIPPEKTKKRKNADIRDYLEKAQPKPKRKKSKKVRSTNTFVDQFLHEQPGNDDFLQT